MDVVTTNAWVLYPGPTNGDSHIPEIAELKCEDYVFPDITECEVLAEPVYGCWEGNMDHALKRRPIDVCRHRGEEKIVIGNGGVVRVLKTGRAVTSVKDGDLCLVFGNAVPNRFGFMKKAYGYDSPQTVGLLAKRTKMHERVVIPIPHNSGYSLRQWAAFSVRYVTAWANWKAAYGSFRSVLSEAEYPHPFVWGWGGGTTLAELELAKHFGCQVTMISSNEKRLGMMGKRGIRPIDRRKFRNLNFDEERYQSDSLYRKTYQEAEKIFLEIVQESTCGQGVSIFLEYLGLPVLRATLKALSCPGVMATAGWKGGMNVSHIRAIECMGWHTHVHTHYARYVDGVEAIRFGEEQGWMPMVSDYTYSWDEIPRLAADYAQEKISTYFPLFQVNPL